jgi:hypothetical protein
MSRFTRRLTSVRFEDAAGLGMTIGPGEGDLTMGEENAENAEHQPVYDRDQHDGFTLGQDLVQENSITVAQVTETLSHETLARVRDFVMKTGSFEDAVSVDDTIWAWVCEVTYQSAGVTTTKRLPKCEGGIASAEGQPNNTFAITFRNHLAPEVE